MCFLGLEFLYDLEIQSLIGENFNPSLKHEAKFTQDQNYMVFPVLNNIEKELYKFPLKQHTADI